jgi:predicted Zn finger-like uncharacterized protein
MNVACPQCTSVFRVDPAKVPAGGVRARCSVCSGVINVPEPSLEEPVTSGHRAGTGTTPAWGRVPTPVGGWTPPPPAIPPTPPGARDATPATPPPGQGSVWGTPASGTAANWGDWPGQAAAHQPAADSGESQPSSDPWGDMGANPLAPEVTPGGHAYPQQQATPAREAPTFPPAFTPTPPAEAPAEAWEPEPESRAETEPAAGQQEPPQVEHEVPGQPAVAPTQAEPDREPAADGHVNPFLRRDPHERARRLARALASDIVTYYPDRHAEGTRDGTLRELFREEIKKSYDDYVAHVGADLAQSTTYFQDALNEVLAGGKRLF